jgi:mRNA-degrading endonuclease RelE of RelBE toxin-antitoxin system
VNCERDPEMTPPQVRHTRRFDNRIERLARKYPDVLDALEELVLQLQQGRRPGKLYRRVGAVVYRVRLTNRSARSGNSGGFRIAYHVSSADGVTLLAICARQDCRELNEVNIRNLLRELEHQ